MTVTALYRFNTNIEVDYEASTFPIRGANAFVLYVQAQVIDLSAGGVPHTVHIEKLGAQPPHQIDRVCASARPWLQVSKVKLNFRYVAVCNRYNYTSTLRREIIFIKRFGRT